MSHALRSHDAPRWWLLATRWLGWLALASGMTASWVAQLNRRANEPPEQWMSQQWLEEFVRDSIKRRGDYR